MNQFNKVVIKNVTDHPTNIHLAVHPFPFGSIHMMMNKGDYTKATSNESNVDGFVLRCRFLGLDKQHLTTYNRVSSRVWGIAVRL